MKNWGKLSLVEQMANIGSEVIRCLKWKSKGNSEYADLANIQAIKLFDLTLGIPSDFAQLKEIARARELWLDFYSGSNQYHQTADQWERYFLAFNFAARNIHVHS